MAVQTNAVDIHLRSSQSMSLESTSAVSVTTWVNCVWNPGARDSFVGIYGPVSDIPFDPPVTAIQIGTASGNNDLTCWTWGGGTLVGTATGFMSGFNNTWVFIAYTFDGVNHRLYRNGIQAATSTTSQTPGFLNQVYINGYPGGIALEVASFQIDQYALYRRTLLPDEIITIYNAAGARHGIFNDIVARYEFDELAQSANVSSVIDLSGNGNNLTPVGAGASMTYTYPNTYPNSNIRPVQ